MRGIVVLLLLLAGPAQAQPVSILAYHRFDPVQASAATVVQTAVFATQMEFLRAHGVQVIRLAALVDSLQGKAPAIAEPAVVLTADDGWRSVYTEMFPLLRKLNFPATLFINPPAIGHGGAYLTWAQIDEMRASGLIEIEAHTQTHPDFNDQHAQRSAADYLAFVDRELAGSRADIAAHGGDTNFFAWPYGINDAALQAAAAHDGFRAAFALGSRPVLAGSPLFALPRYQVYNSDGPARFAAIVAGQPRR